MAILINQPTVTPALGLKKGSSISRPMPLPTVAGIGSMSFPGTAMRLQGALGTNFSRNRLLVQHDGGLSQKEAFNSSNKAQSGLIGKGPKWREKGVQPNMKEVTSAQDLVDSLLNAGEKLVVVDFYSPGCGGCKALHPKICQLAEMNPDDQFLSVNYEERKAMCHSLNVHVLPFFRFYRGAQGRVCSFSCTNATIKKFKDALAKHSPDRCSLGPAKGLEEKELLALAANKDLNFNYTPTSVESTVGDKEEQEPKEDSSLTMSLPLPSALTSKTTEETFKALAAAQR